MNENIVSDKEYLSRPLIENMEYYITPERIKVSCPHTVFIQFVHVSSYTQKEILAYYSDVIKLCRELGVKVHYTNKYKATVLKNWEDYTEAYKKYCVLYDDILNMTVELKKRGLHKGTSDDMFLKKIYKKTAILDTFYYGSNVLSQINSICREFKKIREELLEEKRVKQSGERSMHGVLTDLYL